MKESRTLEYKSDMTNSFLKTVSAFANYGTGVIKFGIKDDGTICGTDNPENFCLDIENKINDSIVPKPNYTLNINKRTKVVTLTVFEGSYKPYLYKGKAFKRNDTATIETDPLELKRLILEGSNMYFEELKSVNQNLTFTYFETLLKDKLGITSLSNDILRTFGFYTKERHFNNAAAIFADENTFAGIDAAKFGSTISEISDRAVFSGMSVLKQYDEAVSMYRRYYQYEKIDGIKRQTIETIPEVAFREAAANALIHRTWDTNSHIRMSMYNDRIEISSPGGLPRGVTEQEYLHGMVSLLRNPVLGNIFFRLKYVEMFGTGIRRIMDAYKEYRVKPSFEIFDSSINVILPVTSAAAATTDGMLVMSLLAGGVMLSSTEIADKFSWSKNKAVRVLNALKSSRHITASGCGRSTKYSLHNI